MHECATWIEWSGLHTWLYHDMTAWHKPGLPAEAVKQSPSYISVSSSQGSPLNTQHDRILQFGSKPLVKIKKEKQPGQSTNQTPIPKIIKQIRRSNKEEKRTIWEDYKDWEYKITNTGPEKYKNKHHAGYKKSLGSSHQTGHNLDFFFK